MKKQPKAKKHKPAKAAKPAKKQVAKKAAAPKPQRMTYRDVPSRARNEIDSLKMSMQPHFMTVEHEADMPRTTQVMDKVYLQRISFEIAGIRQAIERMNKQLSRLETELTEMSD
ncbi:MAG TPA: hypothetical protein PLO51_00190 [Candidatus Micrarchaeota archaeon]|nr:hypothetical protein [Candidatus Micrarchaeota archaeon]